MNPNDKKVAELLARAGEIVSRSRIGAYLFRSESPEGYAKLVGRAFDTLVYLEVESKQ